MLLTRSAVVAGLGLHRAVGFVGIGQGDVHGINNVAIVRRIIASVLFIK